tara:strand:- start:26 stop:514 length:489 start_codon:yes stop_codon:yes gene_type:complete
MKHLLLLTIAAVVLVGCGEAEADRVLFDAVHEESIQAVEQAIAAGADVNAKDDSNITPLLWAIDKSHKEIVELLITKGADVNFKDIAGQTPLDWAEWENSPKSPTSCANTAAKMEIIGLEMTKQRNQNHSKTKFPTSQFTMLPLKETLRSLNSTWLLVRMLN